MKLKLHTRIILALTNGLGIAASIITLNHASIFDVQVICGVFGLGFLFCFIMSIILIFSPE